MRVESVDGWLDAAATRQHGVVARWQMLDAGISRQQVERRSGRTLHAVQRGVYAVGHRALTQRSEWMAAVLAGGPGAVLSHRAGAVLIGLLESWPGVIDVTVPGAGGRRARHGTAIHRSPDVPWTVRDGIPVTTPARTLVDLAGAGVPKEVLNAALRRAEQQELLHAESVRRAMRGRPGATRLRDALAQFDGAPTRSELEVAFLALCERHRILRPEVNVPFLDYTLDFVWPARRIVVETDGMATHGGIAAAIRDRERDAALTRAGFRCQRFAWQQIVQRPKQRQTAETLVALGLSSRR